MKIFTQFSLNNLSLKRFLLTIFFLVFVFNNIQAQCVEKIPPGTPTAFIPGSDVTLDITGTDLNSIAIAGEPNVFSDLILPDTVDYSFASPSATGQQIRLDGAFIANILDGPAIFDPALLAANTDRNLVHYLQLDGSIFAADFVDFNYTTPITAAGNRYVCSTERFSNNRISLQALDVSGNPMGNIVEALPGTTYFGTGVNEPANGQEIGMTIYPLTALVAPGTPIYGIRYAQSGATGGDGGDGKVFIMLDPFFLANPPQVISQTNTQPTCPANVGEIVITAVGNGDPLVYSIDGVNFQPSNTFSGLAPGNYNIQVAYQGNTGCFGAFSGNPVVLTDAGCTSTDLVTTKVVDNAAPAEGDTIVYTIEVTNNGPDDATGVSLTDSLPAGVTYVSDDSAGDYVPGTGVWTIGAIANGSSVQLNITVTVDAGTTGSTITNTTTAASGNEPDPSTAGDDLDEAITVTAADPCDPIASGNPDTDNDGMSDVCDLDDDNDGILDTDESEPYDCTAAVEPLFGAAQGPHSENGSNTGNPLVGDQFRYIGVYAGVDAIITIVSATAGDFLNTLDYTASGNDDFFQPRIDHQAGGYVEFRIDFVNTGTTTPASVEDFLLTAVDNDNHEFISFSDSSTNTYTDTPTNLTPFNSGSPFSNGYIGDGNNVPGIGIADSEVQASGIYNAANSISFRLGDGDTRLSLHAVTLTPCVVEDFWNTPVTISGSTPIDSDGDGIPDSLDLDSDNDGIYDVVEAGGTDTDMDGIADGAIDANGVPGSAGGGLTPIETTPGTPDFQNLDSDGDGCSDANEAYVDANADGGDGGEYGTGTPPATNTDGTVIGAAYNTGAVAAVTDSLDSSACVVALESDLVTTKVVDNAAPAEGDTIV
ncbi:MAG: DUF11 domain-containing protein, partial [Flavobacteriales bacterium]